MIKIIRISPPIELTENVVRKKTALFKADPKNNHVWKESYIQRRLMEMSHNKCCYCECVLGIESNFMEIEHFHDKSHYPDEVVKWNNLLPSCKSCNGNKQAHDTIANPIVNPTIDEPKDHLAFRNYRYEGKDEMGNETKELLHLNDTEKKCMPRFLVCNELLQKVEDFVVDVQSINSLSKTQEKNRMKRKVTELLEACQSNCEYTAIKATTLGTNPDYATLVREMKAKGLWTPTLDSLDASMRSYMFDVV